MLKNKIEKLLINAVNSCGYKVSKSGILQVPRDDNWGDYTTNIAFVIGKKNNISPEIVASNIINKIKQIPECSVELTKAGYINFKINDQFLIDNLKKVLLEKDKYGSSDVGKGKTIVIDYSSPNIAKPFSVGHFRATTIGHAIYNIYKYLGYEVISDNHIGDWGTQFGKIIVAYKKWGDKNKIEKNPIQEFYNLYVKFHQQVDIEPSLNDEARKWFKRLEDHDSQAYDMWKWIVKLSIKEFNKLYDLLDVKFDFMLGESFYEDKIEDFVSECIDKKIAHWTDAINTDKKIIRDEKVLLIDLKKERIDTPMLLKKSDGATLYATRDLTTAKYRIDKWNPKKILYVVGNEQKLYFKQLFKVLEMLGYNQNIFEHINFGLIRMPGGKMSTRKGRTVFIRDVINETVKRAQKFVENKDISEEEKNNISKVVGIGALKYADLSQNRNQDIVFDYAKIMTLKGNSGPYLQYTYARAKSILNKVKRRKLIKSHSRDIALREKNILRKIYKFQQIVQMSASSYMPNYIANYLYELANEFNSFYQTVPILKSDGDEKDFRIMVVDASSWVIKNALGLLGIETLDKM
jgi:arginyl-tRNA synthetase